MEQQIAAAELKASLGSSDAAAPEMRRVVTGLDERDHSVVLFDSNRCSKSRPASSRSISGSLILIRRAS